MFAFRSITLQWNSLFLPKACSQIYVKFLINLILTKRFNVHAINGGAKKREPEAYSEPC